MRVLARVLVAAAAFAAVLVVSSPDRADAAPRPEAAAQAPAGEPPVILPPPEWERWDANGDGEVSTDEFGRLDAEDQGALRSWVSDLLDTHSDGDVREWAREHFDTFTYLLMDIPSPGIGEQIGEAPGAIAEAGGDAVRGIGESAAGSALESVAEAVGDAASDLSGFLGDELARTGRPQLSADWYQQNYRRMLGWAGLLMVPLALASIGAAVARGDTSQVGQTILQVPLAFLLGILAVSLVSAAAGLSVAMARSMVPGIQDSTREVGTDVGRVLAIQPQMSVGLVLLIGLAIALAALATLLWLVLTEAAVYAVVLFFPLAFAGRVWPATAAWGRRLLTTALALIGARVVIFALWGLAMDGLADTTAGDVPLRSALALAALLLMTALAPTAALRLVPLVEGAETAGSPGAALQRGLSVAYQASVLGRSSGLARGGGGRLPVTGQIAGAAARVPSGMGARAAAGPALRSGSGGRKDNVSGPGGSGTESGRGGGTPGGRSGRSSTSGRRGEGAGSRSSGSSTTPAGQEGRGQSTPGTGRSK